MITMRQYKNKLEIINANAINQKSGTIVGSGNEPYIVGKAFGLDELQTSNLLIGNSGIYKLRVIKKTIADDLSDYSDLASKLQSQERENLSSKNICTSFRDIDSMFLFNDSMAALSLADSNACFKEVILTSSNIAP